MVTRDARTTRRDGKTTLSLSALCENNRLSGRAAWQFGTIAACRRLPLSVDDTRAHVARAVIKRKEAARRMDGSFYKDDDGTARRASSPLSAKTVPLCYVGGKMDPCAGMEEVLCVTRARVLSE